MNKVRLNQTEAEKTAQAIIGDFDHRIVSMNENTSLDAMIKREQANKFNNQLENYQEKLDKNNEEFKKSVENVEYDINKAEIKPTYRRILVKPFKQNPFQKIVMEGSIIVDAGGYTPHTEKNPMTGQYEEQDQFIRTGVVIEVGPETKYIRESDVIFYRKDTAVPVPFFKQGLISIDETQVIATVNEGLEARFNSLKNG